MRHFFIPLQISAFSVLSGGPRNIDCWKSNDRVRYSTGRGSQPSVALTVEGHIAVSHNVPYRELVATGNCIRSA